MIISSTEPYVNTGLYPRRCRIIVMTDIELDWHPRECSEQRICSIIEENLRWFSDRARPEFQLAFPGEAALDVALPHPSLDLPVPTTVEAIPWLLPNRIPTSPDIGDTLSAGAFLTRRSSAYLFLVGGDAYVYRPAVVYTSRVYNRIFDPIVEVYRAEGLRFERVAMGYVHLSEGERFRIYVADDLHADGVIDHRRRRAIPARPRDLEQSAPQPTIPENGDR